MCDLFGSMSVLDNVLVGSHVRFHAMLLQAALRTRTRRAEEAQRRQEALAILHFVGLALYSQQQASSLPFGHQRLLEIARALACRPKLLLLDEPGAGLNSSELDFLLLLIGKAHTLGVSVLLIGHTMRLVMQRAVASSCSTTANSLHKGFPTEFRKTREWSKPISGPIMLELRTSTLSTAGIIQALRGISLRVNEGAIVSLLGANGAGKTTVVRTIVGLNRSADNDIRFRDQPIGKVPTHAIVRLGIATVPERRELFPQMSVVDNLEIGAYTRRKAQDVRQGILERVCELFPVLAERRRQRAGMLSGGQQQMLAIGRALMSRPRFLLLDQPTLGLAPLIVRQIFEILQDLNRDGITILLIEQNAHPALKLSEYAYILENGRIVLEGPSKSLRNDQTVQRSYLGAI